MWALAILAVIGLLLDVVVHVSTFFGANPQDWIRPDWLARLIFIGFLLLVGIPALVIDDRRKKREARMGLEFEDRYPFWFWLLVRVAVCYAIFNFFNYGVVDTRRAGGDVERWPGGTYMVDPGHGHPPHAITKDEYDYYRRREVRGGTGFLLMIYLQLAFDLCGLGRRQVKVTPARRVYILSIDRQVFRL
jgi:hypothetical protein